MPDDDKTVAEQDNFVPEYEGEGSNSVLVGGGSSTKLSLDEIPNSKLNTLYRRNELGFYMTLRRSQDPIEKGWRAVPQDGDEDSEFRDQIENIKEEISFDSELMEAHKFATLQGSAEIAFGLKDQAEDPSEEVRGELNGPEDIEFVNVIRQDHIESYERNTDENSPRFGDIDAIDLGDKEIHHERFIHIRPYFIDDDPEGFSFLEPMFTSLKVHENIKFGMGQAMYVSGTGWPVLQVAGLQNMEEDDREDLKNDFMSDILEKPGMVLDQDRGQLEFKGAAGKALNPTNYTEPVYDTLGANFGSKQILLGREAGEITGSELNQKDYYGDISSYQQNKVEKWLKEFVQKLIDWGLVDEPDSGFKIEFEDLFQKSEQTKAEIAETKSKAFMNMVAGGLPVEAAAEEAGLSEEAVEALEESGGASNGSSAEGEEQNQESSSPPASPQTGQDYDMDQSISTREALAEVDGYQDQDYFEGDIPENVTEPINWNEEAYSTYKDLREDLLERFEEFIDDVVDAVDASRVEVGEDTFRDKIRRMITGDQEEETLNRFVLQSKLDRLEEEFQEDQEERTREGLQDAFMVGAREGAKEFGENASKIFDKHREQILNDTMDKWAHPAYKDTTKSVRTSIDKKIEDYFADQNKGLGDLKRDIKQVAGGTDAEDYRFRRIARTETARVRNTAYVDETSRRGRNQFDWIGPSDEKTTDVCFSIKSDNPYTKDELAQVTSGFLPHINCRHTAAVGDIRVDMEQDEEFIDRFQDIVLNRSFTADQEELDEVYSRYQDVTNMSADRLENWTEGECSKKASLSRDPNRRNLRLLRKNKDEWNEKDIKDAKRTISFVSRMKAVAERTDNLGDGPGDCPKKVVIALRNWAYNPM